jgi:NAD(P)H-nitrite reductase large subunit
MTASRDQNFVIVGASLAGAKAAETLRSDGFDGRVVLIGEERPRPYERPPLSKDYLRGEKGFDETALHPAGFYDDNEIELRTTRSCGPSIQPLEKSSSLMANAWDTTGSSWPQAQYRGGYAFPEPTCPACTICVP